MNLPQLRRRRVEILIDNRMLGFLKPTPVSGPVPLRRKRDSLEFLLPRPSGDLPHDQTTDKAS